MSEVATITYSRTKNLGNYESEKLEVTVSLHEGADHASELEDLKRWVCGKLKVKENTDIPF